MSTSVTISKEDGITGNRRRCPREPLKWVVLAFFGETNWGKLVDMNESGMCFEFEQRPALGERISFTLEAMGRMPASFGGESSATLSRRPVRSNGHATLKELRESSSQI